MRSAAARSRGYPLPCAPTLVSVSLSHTRWRQRAVGTLWLSRCSGSTLSPTSFPAVPQIHDACACKVMLGSELGLFRSGLSSPLGVVALSSGAPFSHPLPTRPILPDFPFPPGFSHESSDTLWRLGSAHDMLWRLGSP